MRRLPKFVRVGGLKVGIVKTHELMHDNGHEGTDDRYHRAYGVYEPSGPIIWLDDVSGPERIKVTLVHESLHALVNTTHMQMDPEDEEVLVGRLAPLVLDFIRANRGAIAFLQES